MCKCRMQTLYRHGTAPVQLLAALLAFSALLAGCDGTDRVQVPPASEQPFRAEHAMVVSAHRLASDAGVEVMKKGGNAVDAAVATGFALAVVFPVAGNIGGGGFMVIRFPDGRATTFDYRERAPAAASKTMYVDEDGTFQASWSQEGYLASGVPGSPAGLLLAHERYGRLPLAAVMAPAIRLAERGFPVSRRQAARLNGYQKAFMKYPATRRYFTVADGEGRWAEGDRLRQKDLAQVLRRIERLGADGFYKGRTAELIVAEMRRGGGLITSEDLAAYEAVERPPVEGTYRGQRVISMGPPSSGGVALLQLLNAAEPYDVGAMGFSSSETIHLMGESMRRVYADRAHWLGDPDYVQVPVEELTSKGYTRIRMASFDPDHADASSAVTFGDPAASESMETTHYSVVGPEGMAVSVTTTINGGYGSKVVVDGAGFFLNNEMDDFSAQPGTPNMFGLVGGEANAIAPGKRMLSSMTPTIVEDPKGRLLLVLGTPGGATIITSVYQVMLNLIDHGMNVQEAVAAPRIHHQWLPDRLSAERLALPKDVIRNLEGRGWAVDEGGTWGAVDAIAVRHDASEAQTDPSGLDRIQNRTAGRILYGGADPRGEDAAAGY